MSGRTVVALFLSLILSASAGAVPNQGVSVAFTDPATGESTQVTLYGHLYAVVIGIDRYSRLGRDQNLRYAVADAQGMARVLEERYGFEVTALYNERATKGAIEGLLLDEMRGRLGENDALLVFFAGHGHTIGPPDDRLGYLVPYDGDFNEVHRNISMQWIKSEFYRAIPAKHVLIVADACFGGLLTTRSAAERSERSLRYLRRITRERSAQVLTAGEAGESVLDGGRRGHSIFTGRLIDALEGSDAFLTANEIGERIRREVVVDAEDRDHEQTPTFGRLAGQGDFVFVPRARSGAPEPVPVPPGPPPAATPRVTLPPDRTPPRITLADIPARATAPSLVVTGRVTDDRGPVTLTADGTQIPVAQDGSFRVAYTLSEGTNDMTFVARDGADNEARENASVEYSLARTTPAATSARISPGRVPDGFSVVGSATDPASGLPMRIRHDRTAYEMVFVPAGEFTMGSPDGVGSGDERPQHRVYLDAYWIGVTEVSNRQFRLFRPSHNSRGIYSSKNTNGDAQPVFNVSWENAKAYCDAMGLRLPTEAEWEKAARGTDGREYPWGNAWPPPRGAGNLADQTAKRELDGLATTRGYRFSYSIIRGYDDGNAVTSAVGTFGADEPYGTRDMAGNVWEWCEDWYGAYPSGTVRNPQGPGSGSDRVMRGGTWGDSRTDTLRSSSRHDITNWAHRAGGGGFRVCVSPRQD